MRVNETQIVKVCLQWLRINGFFAWRQNTGAMQATYKGKRRFVRFGEPGMSDIVGITQEGRAFFIECKMPGRKLTTAQAEFLNSVKAFGAIGIVVHSLDELMEKLQDESR